MPKRTLTKDAGVYVRESAKRRHFGKPDVCFEITYIEYGRKKWEKIGWRSEGVTQAYAAQVRRERLEKIRLGESASVRRKVTFAEAFAEWEKIHLPTLKEAGKLPSLARHVLPVFGSMPLAAITALDVAKFQAALLSKGLSKQTVVHAIGLVRRIFKKASLWGMYSGPCPTDGVKLPKIDNERLFYLTKEQARDFLCILGDISPLWRDIAMVSLHTGLRLGDILALRFRQINFTARIIDVVESKAGSYTAYMTPEIAAMFRARAKGRGRDDLVFPSATGTVMHNAGKPFEKAVAETGFNDGVQDRKWRFSFHSLRHTYGSLLAQSGVPDKVISALLGHSSLKMTRRYAKLAPQNKISAVDVVASLYHG